jgi:hypothetical protein
MRTIMFLGACLALGGTAQAQDADRRVDAIIRSELNACVRAAMAKWQRGANGPIADQAIGNAELKQCEDLAISRFSAQQLKGWGAGAADCSLKLDWMLRYRMMVHNFEQKEMAEDRYTEICGAK